MDRSLCPIAPSTEKSSGSRRSEATETKYRLLPALPCASPCRGIHFLRAVTEIPRRTLPFFHCGSALPLGNPRPHTLLLHRRATQPSALPSAPAGVTAARRR